MRTESAALDARAFGFAAGLIAAVVFTACAIGVAIAPDATTAFASYVVHADLSEFARTLTWGNFVGGLLFWTIGTGVVFAMAAVVYNKLSGHSAARGLVDIVAQRTT